MSVVPSLGNGKITVPDLLQRKSQSAGLHSKSEKITCLTAYDYPTARLVDEAGVDVILVGDSLSMVVLGHESTLPVTLEDMLHHTRAVRRGARRALVVSDMPFGSYHTDTSESLRNAVRFVKEAGAEAVKVEGGERRLELIARLTEAEIPVMGHVGLTPQSVNALGGYRVQGKTRDAAEHLIRDARAVEAAGAFAVVLEAVPRELAAQITHELRIPTIGIGAGPDCDGQILVLHDILGLTFRPVPKFARQYANVGKTISDAVRDYCDDVRTGTFPSDGESYHAAKTLKEDEKEAPVNSDGDWLRANEELRFAGLFLSRPKPAIGVTQRSRVMTPEEMRTLYDYNAWANRRQMQAVSKLTTDQFAKPLGSSFGSVRDTLAHIYGAEWLWLERFQGRSPSSLPDIAQFTDVSALQDRWNEFEPRLLNFVRGLKQADLDRVMEYKTLKFGVYKNPLWQSMQHLVNHGTYHRGQVTTLLRQLGAEPILTDLMHFYRERSLAAGA